MSNQAKPANKAELMMRIHAGWNALQMALARFNDEQMTTPGPDGWSIKDQMAHLTAWEAWLVRYHLGGESAHPVLGVSSQEMEHMDVDAVNALLWQRSQSLPLARVRADLMSTHQQVVEALEGVDFQHLLQPRYEDAPERGTLLGYVLGNTLEHYEEHLESIRQVHHVQ